LTEWLDAYGRAWEERDPEAAADLFAEDATYQWGPFGKRFNGRPLIREAWADAVEGQRNVKFGYEVWSATVKSGIARWWVTLEREGDDEPTRIEGIFRLVFGDDGLCVSLEEWYNDDRDTA
jgi:ketosteroid isomerase-like protein